MASWTNLNFQPGMAVAPSLIDQILDDIELLSIHDHSGSTGAGASVLSQNAVFSNTGKTFYPDYCAGAEQHIFPASFSGWSTLSTCNFNTNVYDAIMLSTDQHAASGACLAYIYYVACPLATANGSVNISWKINCLSGPSSGCLAASVFGSASFQADATTCATMYAAASATNFFVEFGNATVCLPGSIMLKLQITGKEASSSGYGGSILAIISDF